MKVYEEFGQPLAPLWRKEGSFATFTEHAKTVGERLSQLSMLQREALLSYGIGIEVEAEHARNIDSDWWNNATDNSLRNEGREYKTPYGMRIHHLPKALNVLQKQAESYEFQFSERTSVHVHLDARTLTMDEAKQIFILYLLFEKALFRYAGADRIHNVFCVPYCESNKCFRPGSFRELVVQSEKYTAINLLTLSTFGTFEFRHMRGNANAEYILNWTMLLAMLRLYATRIPYGKFKELIIGLKTNSQYNFMKDQVFKSFSSLLVIDSKEIDEAITTSKLFL